MQLKVQGVCLCMHMQMLICMLLCELKAKKLLSKQLNCYLMITSVHVHLLNEL